MRMRTWGRRSAMATWAATVAATVATTFSICVAASAFAQKAPPQAQTPPPSTAALPASDFMLWAQAVYPAWFPGLPPTQSLSANGLTFQLRAYGLPSGGTNMLAVGSDGQAYVMGELTGGALRPFCTR